MNRTVHGHGIGRERNYTMSETVNQEPVTTAAGEQQEPRTFTQAEVNSIVADRLTRERTKYADYDDLKTKAQQFDTTKAELDALNAANTQRDMRARVAASTGVPVVLLTGDTEEACTAQAQAALKFAKAKQPGYPDVRDGEPYLAPSAPNYAAEAFRSDRKHEPRSYPYFNY